MKKIIIILTIILFGCNSKDRPIFEWNQQTLNDTSNLRLIVDSNFLKKYIYGNDIIIGLDKFSNISNDSVFVNKFRERYKKDLKWREKYYFYSYWKDKKHKYFLIFTKKYLWPTNKRSLYVMQINNDNSFNFTIELACIEKSGDVFSFYETNKSSIVTDPHQLIIRQRTSGGTDIGGVFSDSIVEYYDLTDLDKIKLHKIDTINNN